MGVVGIQTCAAPPDVIAAVAEFCDSARSLVDYGECYLFGSYAKGRATKDSDIDVAVVASTADLEPMGFMGLSNALFALGYETDCRMEVHLLLDDDDPAGFIPHVRETGIRVA